MSKQTSMFAFFKKKLSDQDQEQSDLTQKSVNVSQPQQAAASSSTDNSEAIGISGDPAFGPQTADISRGPFQPSGCFKVNKILDKSRQFKEAWYSDFKWVEYSPIADAAFCFPCRLFCHHKSGRGEESFTRRGMSNWKKALEKFRKHEKSEMHLKSMQFMSEYKHSGETVADQLSSAHTKKVKENRKYVKFIIENILFLGKQTLALRGHDESNSSFNQGNFLELVQLRCKDKGEEFKALANSAVHSYLSPRIQNEVIELVGNTITQEIVKEVNSCSAYSIICDETTDVSTREQLSICIRYAVIGEKKSEIKERFLGFVDVADTTGDNIYLTIKRFLLEVGVDLSKMRGQAYDGASNMSGKFNGVQAKFKADDSRALYTHCHAHLLDLAVMRFCEDIKHLRNCLSVVNSLYNIINASANRFSIFENICKKNDDSSFRKKRLVSLSKTRWTVRHSALHAIIEQMPEIIETLEIVANDSSDKKVCAKADGLIKLTTNFEFLFSMKVLYEVLTMTDILSKELQSESLDLTRFFCKVEGVIDALKFERTDDSFIRVWNETEELCKEYSARGLDLNRPEADRKRKIPRRLEDGSSGSQTSFQHVSVEEEYKVNIYFAGLDTVIGNLKNRFSENDYKQINDIFEILTSWGSLNENTVKSVQTFYKLSPNIASQLKFFHRYAQKNFTQSCNKAPIALKDVANFFSTHQLIDNVPDVKELIEIALSWPITTATAERSFSTLRRLKTYLRSTMNQERLSALAVMAIEQEEVSKWMEDEKLDELVERFSNSKERRLLLN